MYLFYCKISKPLGFVENQAVWKGVIFGIVKYLCAISLKIKLFPKGNDNKCKKSRTFAIECISYNIRYAEFKEDTKPQSGKNVRPSYLFDVLNI